MTPRRALDPYLMLAPTALLLAVFFFYPLVYACVLSLHDWDLLTPPRFVGFAQYAELIRSGELASVFVTTLEFSVVVVLASVVAGLGLAVALNRTGPFAAFVRGAIFSAYVVSWVTFSFANQRSHPGGTSASSINASNRSFFIAPPDAGRCAGSA